jgi:TPR repeat protein
MKAFVIALAMIAAAPAVAADCDVACKMDKALKGDGQAALDMAQVSLAQKHDEMVNWYRIAAENGSPLGQWIYANWLVTDSRSRQDCIRAAYWLERARASGYTNSVIALDRLTSALKDETVFEKGCRGAL